MTKYKMLVARDIKISLYTALYKKICSNLKTALKIIFFPKMLKGLLKNKYFFFLLKTR